MRMAWQVVIMASESVRVVPRATCASAAAARGCGVAEAMRMAADAVGVARYRMIVGVVFRVPVIVII